jgi:transcriptional regulator with XRE-family HTH domain
VTTPADLVSSPVELGARLRDLRKSRGLSLADVSAGTGISASFLSMVEKGRSDITITRLIRLVRWYEISLADLIQDADHSPVHIVRADERKVLEMADEKISILMLAGDGRHGMMPVMNVYAEGGGMSDPVRHEGEEFVLVLSGAIEVRVGSSEPFVLRTGDSAYYRADIPHSYRNVGKGEARFVGVTTPPNL